MSKTDVVFDGSNSLGAARSLVLGHWISVLVCDRVIRTTESATCEPPALAAGNERFLTGLPVRFC